MDRRTFTKYSALTVLGQAAIPGFAKHFNGRLLAVPELLGWLIQLNDQSIPSLLARQEINNDHPWFGGIKNEYHIYTPQGTAHFIKTIACSLVMPYSEYYHSEKLIERLEIGITYLLRAQHADGTIDLLSTNFHSTPDTGFIVKRLSPVYTLLNRMDWPMLALAQEKLQTFLLRAGEALCKGGIHTPNHRWVVSAALAWLNRLFPGERYVERIDQWLDEGIDIDSDGQFHEKSTYIYSPLSDRTLITIARLLDRPDLLEPVRKNLEMTLYYIHPNGEVVTEASGRQDQYQIGYMEHYYYPYRYMAIKDNNPRFAAVCQLIEETRLPSLTQYLNYLLEDPELWKNFPQPGNLPTNYVKMFPHSGLVRIRRDQIDATIISDNATFFTIHKGQAVLQAVRLASAFFGKGQFVTENIEEKGNRFVLRQRLEGPYYQPYPVEELPGDGDWDKMPRSNRPQSEIQELEATVVIIEDNGTFQLIIDIKGTENVPVAVELAFRHGGTLSNVSTVEDISSAFVLKSGYGQYRMDDDVITFGPGHAEHTWIQLRGAMPKLDAQCVYLTGFTPFHQVFEFS